MQRRLAAFDHAGNAMPGSLWAVTAILLLLVAGPMLPAGSAVVEIGTPEASSRVPGWDARGLGPLPRQGIACCQMSADGRFLAIGTIAAPGDHNLFLLDGHGRIAGRHRAGMRWVQEVSVSDDGRLLVGVSAMSESAPGDTTPRLFGFWQGRELTEVSDRFVLRDFRPDVGHFHYGEHSNHMPPVSCWAGGRWIVAATDRVYWLLPGDVAVSRQVPLGPGRTTAWAANQTGLVAIGRLVEAHRRANQSPNLFLLKPDPAASVVWSRPASTDVAPAPAPEKGVYGPPAPPYEDLACLAPLAVAIDPSGKRVAVADYQAWQRVFHPRNGSAEVRLAPRFMPARPTIHVYDDRGHLIGRIGPAAFAQPFWADLTFSADGRKLLVWPHNWTSRGLGGQSFLPADGNARTLYLLDIDQQKVLAVRFPDAISSVATANNTIVVGCWNHRVYLLDGFAQPIKNLPNGVHVGSASLVRISKDGKRIAAATSAGTVHMLQADGRELWQLDLNKAVPPGDKPWTRNQIAARLAPGIWTTNGGLAPSDLGRQTLIEAPHGLILIDPNAGASFEQNWARIQAAGLDPMQVKYVLITHEHGDHAPGAYLWRVITGAQAVASAETAYILQHHIPHGVDYGFHPPIPIDIVLTGDRDLELAGLRIQAMRLPGHTAGSLGYAFRKNGRLYVATGDLIMPGGVLGWSGSLDFSAEDVLHSLKKLARLQPDVVLGGHGGGDPHDFIAKGIEAGEATGWSKMVPPKPNPLYRFTRTNYLIAAWLEKIRSAAYGDVDGDSRPDVAILVPQGRGSAVKIYLNRGGRFAPSPDAVVELADLSDGWKLRLVRLNADRIADFFVSNELQARLLLSRPAGLAFRVVPLAVTRGAHVATDDFDRDGKPDLLIGPRFVAGYSIAYQHEDGAFRLYHASAPARFYMDMALADVNGDQQADLLTSCGEVFLRQADGSLGQTPAFSIAPPPGEPKGWAFLAAADFDRDNHTDVALLANHSQGTTVWLYRNSGKPGAPFPPEPSRRFVVAESALNRDGPTVADFNGDGIADVILGATGSAWKVRILLGSRDDGLNPKRVLSIPLDYQPHFDTRFGVADFDGDGRGDLAGFGPSAVGAMGVYIYSPGKERP